MGKMKMNSLARKRKYFDFKLTQSNQKCFNENNWFADQLEKPFLEFSKELFFNYLNFWMRLVYFSKMSKSELNFALFKLLHI